jgi:2-succinyl-5-enolpyruvyl-6-hydroxy-3-cyclohexene-1-carboxylate synthase
VSESDVALACAFAFVDQLAFEGLEHACISPGSRSTPIALALSRHPKVRVHVHLDERASAFFALGIAKATHRPVAAVTTSGTAAAELLPAVVEASMSRTPVLLLTADRPPELRGVGANQTIDQQRLYGRYVKEFIDAPVPGDDIDEWGWRRRAEFATSTAVRPWPGPVHVNLPFREPLVATTTSLKPNGRPIAIEQVEVQLPRELGDLLRDMEGVSRGMFVLGSLRTSAPEIPRLADRLQWPVLAEPMSGLRVPGTLTAGQFLISNADFVSDQEPDLIVQVGAAPTSRAGLSFVTRAHRLWILDPDDLVADPNRVAAGRVVVALAGGFLRAIDRLPSGTDPEWRGSWSEADERARHTIDALLDSWDEPFEGRIARDVADSTPDGSTLVVGSSMPVRDLDAYMRPRDGLRVLANRGASGIDGFVSTALGVAATGVTTTALCGDLTLLHDVGSLLWSAQRGHDCVFVVPNNDGGAIFSFLPQRELPEFEELFVTPHGLDLAAVCRAAGAGHTLVERAGELIPAIDRARDAGGVHVVEVPTDRERNVELHAAVGEAVGAALRASSM